MKAVIDTSSLVSLVRYYLPFDHDGKLKDFLEEQVVAKKIPEICKTLEVLTMNLPTFLSKCGIINLSIDVIKTTLF